MIKEGIFDHRLFQTLNFPILLFVCTIDGMLLLGVNTGFSQEIYDILSTDAVQIAVILCPYLITSTFGCIPAGFIMAKTRSYRTLLVAALMWCSLFTGMCLLYYERSLPLLTENPSHRLNGARYGRAQELGSCIFHLVWHWYCGDDRHSR